MKKRVGLFCLLSVVFSATAMDITVRSDCSSASDDDMPVEQPSASPHLESDFLLYVPNASIIKSYRNVQEDYTSTDHYWRKNHRKGSHALDHKFQKRMAPFKQFLEVMDEGRKKFNAKEQEEPMPEGKDGAWIRLAVQPPQDPAEVERVYLQTPYVYKVLAGTGVIGNYLAVKRAKKRPSSSNSDSSSRSSFSDLAAMMEMMSRLGGAGTSGHPHMHIFESPK